MKQVQLSEIEARFLSEFAESADAHYKHFTLGYRTAIEASKALMIETILKNREQHDPNATAKPDDATPPADAGPRQPAAATAGTGANGSATNGTATAYAAYSDAPSNGSSS